VTPLLKEIRHDPLLWLLALVPVVLAAQLLKPEGRTLLFMLPVAAIVPLAALLSRATRPVATELGRSACFVGALVVSDLRSHTLAVAARVQ
jgi:Ca2+:H+ antiporter